MEDKDKSFMRYGAKVTCDGEEYVILEGMNADTKKVKGVKVSNKRRYDLLRAWSTNHVGLTDEQREEMESLIEVIDADRCEASNAIRFITSGYETLFTVKNLDYVEIGGKVYKAVYIDDYHLYLIAKGGGYPRCFHICELAEWRERNGLECKPA